MRLELPDDQFVRLVPRDTLTDAELTDFCHQNPLIHVEQTPQGDLLIMPPTHTDSSRTNARINLQLGKWWEKEVEAGSEIFDSSGGFRLPDGSLRSPDAAWISPERWLGLSEAQRRHRYSPVCPDFVIELKSYSDSLSELQRKMTDTWLANGTQLAFLIDPETETSWIYRAGQAVPDVFAGFDRELSGDPTLPGFALDLRWLR